MELRPYQQQAAAATFAALADHRSTLVVMPTGTGKTILFAAVAERFRPLGRALILAHREELVEQACDKVQRSTRLTVGVEMGQRRTEASMLPDVVVASVQSLSRPSRRERFTRESFALVVIDEAHHATSASYRAIIEHFPGAKLLGVTATPDRGDGVGLRAVFSSVAFEYSLRHAIADGYLVTLRQRAITVASLDVSRVRTVAGDLHAGDLDKLFTTETMLHEVAVPLVEQAGDRSTIVFTVSVEHAHALTEVIGRYAPGQARALDGMTDHDVRRATIDAFALGEFRFLVNCALFTEGFDIPGISCVAIVRPTKSRAFYAQMVGRGTRLAPGKSDCLILDFRGNAGRHALVSAVDVLGGKDLDESTKNHARTLVEKDPQLDLLTALDRAAAHQVRCRPEYHVREVDPFGLSIAPNAAEAARLLALPLLPIDERSQPATQQQRDWLVARGLPVAGEALYAHHAAALLAELRRRQREGLASYKQLRLLARRGVADAHQITFARAMVLIDQIMSRWRRRVAT